MKECWLAWKRIDYFILLKPSWYFWLQSTPNILVVEMECVYELTQKARENEKDFEDSPDIDWWALLSPLGFEWSDGSQSYIYTGGDKQEKPDVHPSAEQFVDTDPEPF